MPIESGEHVLDVPEAERGVFATGKGAVDVRGCDIGGSGKVGRCEGGGLRAPETVPVAVGKEGRRDCSEFGEGEVVGRLKVNVQARGEVGESGVEVLLARVVWVIEKEPNDDKAGIEWREGQVLWIVPNRIVYECERVRVRVEEIYRVLLSLTP